MKPLIKELLREELNEISLKNAVAGGLMTLGSMGAAKAQTAPATPAPTTQTTPAPKPMFGTPEQRAAAAEKRKQNRQKIFDNFVKGAFNTNECVEQVDDEEFANGCTNTDNDESPYINGTSPELPDIIYRELQDGTKIKINLKKYRKIIKKIEKQDDVQLDGLEAPNFKSTKCGISKAGAKQSKKDWSKK
jgi:hypothetical protein